MHQNKNRFGRIGLGAFYGLLLLLVFDAQSGPLQGKTNPEFTRQEIQWMKNHPVIRVVVNSSPLPLSTWADAEAPDAPPDAPPDVPPDVNMEQPLGFRDPPPGPTGGERPRPGMPPHPPPGPFGEIGRPLVHVEDAKTINFQGVAADYLDAVSRITGMRFVVVLAGDNNFQEIGQALLEGQADLMPTFMLDGRSGEQHRPKGLHLTAPYISIPVVIITRPDAPYIENLEMLRNMKLAGTHPTGRKLRSLGLRLRFAMASPRDGLMGVATGRFDAFICELFTVSTELDFNPITNIKISGELPVPSRFAMAVGPHLEILASILSKTFETMPAHEKDKIRKKWFRVNYEKKWTSSFWAKVGLAIGLVVLLAGVFAIRYFYQRFHKIRTTIEALDPHLLSVQVNRDIVITEVTEALCNATGFKTDDLVGQPLMALGSPIGDNGEYKDRIWKILERGDTWSSEVKIVKKDGSSLWAEAVISPLRRKEDQTSGFTIHYQDVTQKKHYETLAVRDELTGLYNRRHFNSTVPALLEKSQKGASLFFLILLDVDNFKKYNDNYGHPAGDRVLASIGAVLRKIFKRNDDMVFRLGGEEFGAAVLVSSTEEAEGFAVKILEAVRSLRIEHQDNPPGTVTVSAGGVLSTKEVLDMEALYKRADSALYQAKEGGRNTFKIVLG